VCAVCAGAALARAAGAAEEGRGAPAPPPRKYTLYVDRGMSLPAPYVYGTLGFTGTARTGSAAQLEGSLGGGIGLTKRLWIDGSSGALRVAPELVFHSAQLGVSAQLVDTPAFELDATTHVAFAAEDKRPIEQVEPGLFAVVHVPHELRFDAGLYLDVNPGAEGLLGARMPVGLSFQIVPKVHATLNTGVTVGSFADPRGTTAIPAGLTLGWSDNVGQGKQAIAVLPSVSWPELVKPGTEERFRPGYAVVGVTLFVVTSR